MLVRDAKVLIHSPAIIEWLEERYLTPALLPASPDDRAHGCAMAAIISCDIHPVNNRRILEYLRRQIGCDDAAVNAWCVTWIGAGFDALEALLAADKMRCDFCLSHAPTIADVYLVPQVESACRFKIDLEPWPHIRSVEQACATLDAFRLAAPALQPDAG